MVYDCFMFFNELDLLEIRLNILDPYVDYFVISECDTTFSGNSKKLYYEENKDRFKKFHHKIIHQVITDCPNNISTMTKKSGNSLDDICYNSIVDSVYSHIQYGMNAPQWLRDYFQRECVKRGLVNCSDDDIIMVSDLDEIPSEEFVKNIHSINLDNTFAHLMMKMSSYFFNIRKDEEWFGTKVMKYEYLKTRASNYFRNAKNEGIRIPNAGNHFTFLGGVEKIKEKCLSYGHAFDFDMNSVFNNLEYKITNCIDLFGRTNDRYFKVELDDSFPKFIIENKEKYKELFL